MLGDKLHGPDEQMRQAIHVERESDDQNVGVVGRGEQFRASFIQLESAVDEQRLCLKPPLAQSFAEICAQRLGCAPRPPGASN